jgi:GDP-mannose 6-dehydrogenase
VNWAENFARGAVPAEA